MNVSVNMDDVGTMLRRRGLEPNGRVQKLFSVVCARKMDPYVPMQSGLMKNARIIGTDSVTYPGPYAKFDYNGKVMLGIESHSAYANLGERKEVTDRDLQYHGAPKRGPFWDRRMWADKKSEVVNEVALAAGGTAK